jgi:hypothetical protein
MWWYLCPVCGNYSFAETEIECNKNRGIIITSWDWDEFDEYPYEMKCCSCGYEGPANEFPELIIEPFQKPEGTLLK